MRKLERAMLLYLRYPVTKMELPASPDRKLKPRLQILDSGLMNYSVGIHADYFRDIRLADVYRGILAEQMVWQEMLSQNNRELSVPPFWVREKKQSNAEVDFVYSEEGRMYPVEVKSGKDGTLRSLHQLICQSDINLAIRLFDQQYSLLNAVTPSNLNMPGKEYRLLSLPFYCAGKIADYIKIALGTF